MRRRRLAIASIFALCALGVGATAIDLGEVGLERAEHTGRASARGVQPNQATGELELRAPTGSGLLVPAPNPYYAPPIEGDARRVQAYEIHSRVYSRPQRDPRAIGLVRRGSTLLAGDRVHGPGCPKGTWYELPGGGTVCTSDGFAVSRRDREVSFRQPQPDVKAALPYQYGRVNTREALRFYRIPEPAEETEIERALTEEQRLPEVVQMQLQGDYFVAIDRLERSGEREFYRTLRGRYVRKEQVDLKQEPAMQGSLLDDQTRLPLAFVFGDPPGAPLLKREGGGTQRVGTAHVHSRFVVQEMARWDGVEVAVGAEGLAVAREHLRIARRREAPEDIAPDDKWIHVDLDQQTLVAYRGSEPVFATLVSSGKEGYETPRGLFRVRQKHITTTMRGEDPVEGPYEVAEVPWTLYYWKSYALHGAYWHNTFGRVRSHGCTNLSPIDARWLFHFTDDPIPQGWHARRQLENGTWVWISRGEPEPQADS